MLRTISLTVLLLATAGPAFAHPGHDGSGFLHPFTGIDHLLVMVGVGLWASLLAARKPAASFLVPGAFVAMMAVGAAAGFAGIKLPLVEAAILASVFVIGGLIMGAVRLPAASAMAVVGLFALFHGYAHALEAPRRGPAPTSWGSWRQRPCCKASAWDSAGLCDGASATWDCAPWAA